MHVKLILPAADYESVEALRDEIARAGIPLKEPDPLVLESPEVEGISLVLASVAVIRSLTPVVQAYLSRNKDREIKIQTKDQGSVTIKGSSIKEVNRLLESFLIRPKDRS